MRRSSDKARAVLDVLDRGELAGRRRMSREEISEALNRHGAGEHGAIAGMIEALARRGEIAAVRMYRITRRGRRRLKGAA